MQPLRRWPLASYFVLAYAWTWAAFAASAEALTAMSQARSPGPLIVLGLLAPFGPALAALAVTAAVSGRTGVRDLLRRVVRGRLPLVATTFLLSWLLVARLCGAAVWSVVTGAWPAMPNLLRVGDVLPRFVMMILLGGPLGEEPGWRGFALPRLVERHGPVGASLRLGPLWAFWHLPVFFIPGLDQYGQPILLYALMVTAYTFVFTWGHLRSGGSLPLALLHHAAINTTLWLTSMPELAADEWRLLGFSMPGPWLVACGLAWALVGALAWRGAFRGRAPANASQAGIR